MRFLARFFLFISIFYLLSSIFSSPAHAQYANPYVAPNTDTNVPANLHTYTQSIVLEVLAAFTCQIIGQDPLTTTHQCLGLDTTTGKIGYVPSNGGAVGFVNNMIADLYTPPINTAGYVHYVASNFGLVKHTYAKETGSDPGTGSNKGSSSSVSNGIGFDRLTPLLGLWTTFRNIAYLAFVIIFVVIGFAIMLRVKIDPRTVMTIENQIPKIIIALLLVTFSYAIAGFLIDMMYVTTYLTINVITNAQGVSQDTAASIRTAEKNDLAGGNPLGFMNDVLARQASGPAGVGGGGFGAIVTGTAGSVKDIVQSIFYEANISSGNNGPGDVNNGGSIGTSTLAGGVIGALGCGFIGGIISGGIFAIPAAVACGIGGAAGGAALSIGGIDVPTLVRNVVGNLMGDIVGILALLIIGIAILVAMFRVWLALILAYVSILLDIVLAPFIIIIGVFPGTKIGFGSWLKGMIGNLLAYPVTVAMFLLAKVFMENFAVNGATSFVPPLIGNPIQAAGQGQSPVAYIIALGMILLTPNVVGMTRGLVGAGENKAFAGIFQGIGIGGKATGGVFKQTFGALFGNEIEYTPDGTIKTLTNPLERFRRGFVRRVGGG